MIKIAGCFNRHNRLDSVAIAANGDIHFTPIFAKGTGLTLYEAQEKQKTFLGLLSADNPMQINNLMQFRRHFNNNVGNEIWDQPGIIKPSDDFSETKDKLSSLISKYQEPNDWQRLRAEASEVYYNIENRGIKLNDIMQYPKWGMNTFSGRSSTSKFNIQGASEEDNISNPNGESIFIHLDWVAADIRVASIMSGDKQLEKCFFATDPYNYIADYLNDAHGTDFYTRSDAKRSLLSAINQGKYDSPVLKPFSDLSDWVKSEYKSIRMNKKATSLLGREFYIKKDRTVRSIFNAIIQGSVAHAMHSIISTIYRDYGDSLLYECHDSIVVTARDSSDAKSKIQDLSSIMYRPFRGILKDDPRFPFTVSVGKKFKNWREIKRKLLE